ncbi:MAG TPA: LacI family DNA-binding transcriptional regulator [Pseudothermotoga sp.]|nr:LacI family DNA-binding transcriptional regulator [Pseudothermotoga sp.]HOK83323.1 LacI family DNA-binding transcriptional regulator [Pseudothermotoga sp.]HPP70148.1 LacI family DNA-binding transcriptional regulator [Pseudothermotoga sp.]
MKKITIKDVASIAGVSISTVSRVLNSKGNVDPQLKEKVLQVIRETGFQPSNFARSFRKNSVQVDVILSKWLEQYLRVLRGLIQSLSLHQISVGLKTDLGNLGDYVVAIGEEFDSKLNAMMVIGKESSCFSVVFDYFSAMNSMIEDFLKKGIETFAFLCEDLSSYRTCKLYSTFMKIMFHHKIESYEVKVLNSKRPYDVTMELSTLPGAIICSSDEIAADVMKALKDEGVKIPGQVSVAGYGNLSYATLLEPTLSSVEYMNEEVGAICGKYVLKMINGEQIPEKIILGTKLIKRESTI